MPKVGKSSDGVIYIGIDPGQKGGLIALIPIGSGSGNTLLDYRVRYTPMPATERDIWLWFACLPSNKKVAVIEKVHSMPNQSAQSGFTFGHNYGFLKCCLIVSDVSFDEVSPQIWMKELGIPFNKSKEKNRTQWKHFLKGKAQQLFPDLPIWAEKDAVMRQLAISDALLISEFCRRRS